MEIRERQKELQRGKWMNSDNLKHWLYQSMKYIGYNIGYKILLVFDFNTLVKE